MTYRSDPFFVFSVLFGRLNLKLNIFSGYVDREFFIKAGRQGLIGVEQPKEKGGWGLDFAANIIGMEEQIYAQVPGNFNLQSDLVMPYIASHGTDAQIQVEKI